jgi:D-alanine---D-serine ligase
LTIQKTKTKKQRSFFWYDLSTGTKSALFYIFCDILRWNRVGYHMKKKKIAVLFGGMSPEYEVSLESSHAVLSSIRRDQYEVLPLGITKTGQWYRYTGPLVKIRDDTWHLDRGHCRATVIAPDRPGHLLETDGACAVRIPLDAVFPVLHGRNGEDGTIQGLCALAGIPVVGCGTLSSALCMDKDRAHKLVAAAGIRVPKSVCIKCSPSDRALEALTANLSFPLFVKPVRAGSSIGISKVLAYSQLMGAIQTALCHDNTVLLEESIGGFEVGCAVMGNDDLVLGRVDEIELADGFFDYTEKYTLKTSKIHMPARLDKTTEARIKETAAHIYRILGCAGFARVDMFLTPDQDIVFNEVNTIPGFTSHSRFPNMMKGVGIDFEALVDRLLELGLRT